MRYECKKKVYWAYFIAKLGQSRRIYPLFTRKTPMRKETPKQRFLASHKKALIMWAQLVHALFFTEIGLVFVHGICFALELHFEVPMPQSHLHPCSPRVSPGQRISVGVIELMALQAFFQVRSCDFPDLAVFALFQSLLCRFVMWERVLPAALEVLGHMSQDEMSDFRWSVKLI